MRQVSLITNAKTNNQLNEHINMTIDFGMTNESLHGLAWH